MSFTTVLLATVLLPSLFTLPAIGRPGKGMYLSGPKNQTVAAGSEAVLTCGDGVSLDSDVKCHWLKDGFLMGTGSGRFQMMGGCELRISPVLDIDQGEYQCQVPGPQPMVSTIGMLSVDVEPGHPRIDANDVVTVDRDQMLELECVSSGGRPAGEIQWWNADTGDKIVSEVTNNLHREGGSFTSTSTLRMKAKNHMKVYCTVHSEAFPAMKQSNPVEVSIKGEPRKESIFLREGDSVKIFCHNRMVNDVMRFKWFINDNQIKDENKDVLEITDFNKAFDGSVVKCVVTDMDGVDETVRLVELKHNQRAAKKIVAKSFDELTKKKSIVAKKDVMMNDEIVVDDIEALLDESDATKGKKTTFICVVEDDSNNSGEPKYVWIDGKLTKKTDDDVSADKRYKCKVVKNGQKKINKMAKDLKTYSKSIKKMSKFLNDFSNY